MFVGKAPSRDVAPSKCKVTLYNQCGSSNDDLVTLGIGMYLFQDLKKQFLAKKQTLVVNGIQIEGDCLVDINENPPPGGSNTASPRVLDGKSGRFKDGKCHAFSATTESIRVRSGAFVQ